jgi:hypothetical protein
MQGRQRKNLEGRASLDQPFIVQGMSGRIPLLKIKYVKICKRIWPFYLIEVPD